MFFGLIKMLALIWGLHSIFAISTEPQNTKYLLSIYYLFTNENNDCQPFHQASLEHLCDKHWKFEEGLITGVMASV